MICFLAGDIRFFRQEMGKGGKTENKQHVKVLIIEDDDGHVALICRHLAKTGSVVFDTERAERMSSGIEFLGRKNFDVVILDLGLPDSLGLETIAQIHRSYPNTPVIVLTALDDEDTATRAVQSGAQDYLVKGHIDTEQLVRSIRYSIERQKLVTQLEKSLSEIKTLRGLLPMCAWCRKIRDDQGYWQGLEAYIQQHTDAAFTHGICPECLKKVNPVLFEKIKHDHPRLLEKQNREDDT